jgi:hypothetical protein
MSHPERSVARSARHTQSKDLHLAFIAAALCLTPCVLSQQQLTTPPHSTRAQPASIATVSLEGVTVSGSLSVADGRAIIGNNGTIAAGDKTAQVQLTRGGALNVCATTEVHLTTNASTPGGALMIALNRGAFEAHYTAGEYSDVILTPDLRILISPPGDADLSLRVNENGDTCVDNHGSNAPYVLATNQFSGGAYRVQPNQRVLFEHGSLNEVVDNETEPCGCPPATSPVNVARGSSDAARSAAKQNPFPLAESEGLAPPPGAPAKPDVPPGQVETEVQAPLTYNGAQPQLPPSPPAPAAQAKSQKPHRGFFRRVGHFFRHVFGGK